MKRGHRQFEDMRLRLLFAPQVAVSLLGVALSLVFFIPAAEGSLLGPIHKVLSYYSLHPDEVTDDFLFGVMLTEEQLRASKSVDERIENDIDKLLALCEIIMKNSPLYYDYSDEIVKGVGESLKLLRTPKVKLNLLEHLPYKLENNLRYGSPTPFNSTVCQLAVMTEKKAYDSCVEQMSDTDARGYTLSHQAIFYTLAASLLPLSFVEESIHIRCEKMLSEVYYAWKNEMPDVVRDLVIEEVAICGINRYEEFLTKPMLDFILRLQHEEGCFSISKEGPLSKCRDHLSAVSLTALSNFLFEQSASQ